MATSALSPSSSNQVAQQMLLQSTPYYTFTFTPFLQKTYQHSLPADRPICKAFQSGHCTLKTHCTERHATAQPGGFGGKEQGGFGSLVCKHWLRGLCKKGDGCEFLHEYNLRKMPECNFFVRNGYCSNGDECLYLHIDPQTKLPSCPHYDRGFCPLGPRCDKKHARRRLCPYFLAGFCPEGRACKDGAHPKWVSEEKLERPKVKEDKKKEEDFVTREEERERERDRDRDRDRDQDGDARGHDRHGHKDRLGNNRGGRWRGKGRFRGRNR